MTTLRVLCLRFGSERHGVNRYGRDVAAGLRSGAATEVTEAVGLDPRTSGPGIAARCRTSGAHLVHLHVTEQLFGADPEEAAANLGHLASFVDVPIVTTLHDVPTPDTALDRRRRRFYDVALEQSRRAVVCSRHEQARLGSTRTPVDVVPHLVPPSPRPATRRHDDRVAVLGFLYPGKGHESVIAACAASSAGAPPPFLAIGEAAARHPELPEQLVALGREVGVDVTVTGWVADGALPARLAEAACPVVPNHGVSASGSLATWVGAGRRPLVAAGPYAAEFAKRAPGCVHLYEPGAGPDELAAAIRRSMADPASTHVAGPPAALSPERIGAAHRTLFAEVAR
jgi:hypothetical protein